MPSAMLNHLVQKAALVTALASCGLDAPETGYQPSADARAAGFPALLQADALAAAIDGAGAAEGATLSSESDAGLAARSAALRARAEALAGPVIAAEDVDRLLGATGD